MRFFRLWVSLVGSFFLLACGEGATPTFSSYEPLFRSPSAVLDAPLLARIFEGIEQNRSPLSLPLIAVFGRFAALPPLPPSKPQDLSASCVQGDLTNFLPFAEESSPHKFLTQGRRADRFVIDLACANQGKGSLDVGFRVQDAYGVGTAILYRASLLGACSADGRCSTGSLFYHISQGLPLFFFFDLQTSDPSGKTFSLKQAARVFLSDTGLFQRLENLFLFPTNEGSDLGIVLAFDAQDPTKYVLRGSNGVFTCETSATSAKGSCLSADGKALSW